MHLIFPVRRRFVFSFFPFASQIRNNDKSRKVIASPHSARSPKKKIKSAFGKTFVVSDKAEHKNRNRKNCLIFYSLLFSFSMFLLWDYKSGDLCAFF